MTTAKRARRAADATQPAATSNVAPAGTSIDATEAVGGISPPVVSTVPPGTDTSSPLASDAPEDQADAEPGEIEAAPEPTTTLDGGGSYIRDRATGILTRQEA